MNRRDRTTPPRRGVRTAIAVTTALAALAASAAPALAGQIVYSTEPADGDAQIRVMDDDGSNDRLLVHEDDVPGAESVYSPYVSPGGDTVVFQARTPGPSSGGVYCGFRCSGVYAYSGGWSDDQRPFGTSPTFVGGDRVAFIHGETIRTISTSCSSCDLGSTTELGGRPGVDGIAWTSRSIPDPVAEVPGEQPPAPAPAPVPPAPVGPAPAPP